MLCVEGTVIPKAQGIFNYKEIAYENYLQQVRICNVDP